MNCRRLRRGVVSELMIARRIKWPKIKACPNCGKVPVTWIGLCDEDGNSIGPYGIECPWRLAPTYWQTCNQQVIADSPREAAEAWNLSQVNPPLLGL